MTSKGDKKSMKHITLVEKLILCGRCKVKANYRKTFDEGGFSVWLCRNCHRILVIDQRTDPWKKHREPTLSMYGTEGFEDDQILL